MCSEKGLQNMTSERLPIIQVLYSHAENYNTHHAPDAAMDMDENGG